MTGMSGVKPTVATLYVCITDMTTKIDEVYRAVIGNTDTPGITSKLLEINNRVKCLENENETRKIAEKENKQELNNFWRWFFEKWFAPIVTVITTALIMKLIN